MPSASQIFRKGRAVGKASAEVVFLFLIRSGVIQGCPLASFCFVISFDPFLNLFDRIIEKKNLGIVRACADDVGCALYSIEALPKVATVFRLAERFAGLIVKPKKSAIVPVTKWETVVRDQIKTWVLRLTTSTA